MPKPKPNERKNNFLHRCVHEVVHSEGKDPKQAVAVCYGKWNEYKENKKAEDSVVLRFWKRLKGEVNKEENLVQCGNCLKLLDYSSIPEAGMGYIECPECGKNIDQKGNYYKEE